MHEQRLLDLMHIEAKLSKVEIDGKVLNYVIAGKGYPLLLVHGLNIGWGLWYKNIGEMAKHFKVYAIDLPGSGSSYDVDYSKLDLEKDLVEVVSKFCEKMNFGGFNFVGHSLGGWIGIKLALRKDNNLNKLVLVNSLGFSDHVPFKYRLASFKLFTKFITLTAMKPTRKNLKDFLSSVFYDKGIKMDDEFVDYYYKKIKKNKKFHPLWLINRMSGVRKMKKELVLLDKLASLKKEILIIFGDKDPQIPIEKVYNAFELIPGAKIEILTDIGHVPAIESPKFNNLIIDFLKS